jgi:hypothetical protein
MLAALLGFGTLVWAAAPEAQAQGLGITIGRGGVNIGSGVYGPYPVYGAAPGVVTYGRGYAAGPVYAPSYVAPAYVPAPIYGPTYVTPRRYVYPRSTYRVYPRYRWRRW